MRSSEFRLLIINITAGVRTSSGRYIIPDADQACSSLTWNAILRAIAPNKIRWCQAGINLSPDADDSGLKNSGWAALVVLELHQFAERMGAADAQHHFLFPERVNEQQKQLRFVFRMFVAKLEEGF
jgi:hypothetical protein